GCVLGVDEAYHHVDRIVGCRDSPVDRGRITPVKASSASLTVPRLAISGTGCGPLANHVVLQRAKRTVRGRPRPARPVRSHKTLSNSGRRYAWARCQATSRPLMDRKLWQPSETWEGLLALAQT